MFGNKVKRNQMEQIKSVSQEAVHLEPLGAVKILYYLLGTLLEQISANAMIYLPKLCTDLAWHISGTYE